MDFQSAKISYLVTFIFVAATVSLAETDDVKVIGYPGDNSASYVYVGRGSDVILSCNVSGIYNGTGDKLHWAYKNQSNFAETPVHCLENEGKGSDDDSKESDEDDSKPKKRKKNNAPSNKTTPFSECKITHPSLEKSKPFYTLELEDMIEVEFGEYICYTGDKHMPKKSFIVVETVILRRSHLSKSDSVTIEEGQPFDLYCNATGLQKWHVVSWWEGDQDITEELRTQSGKFANLTRKDDLNYSGTATMDLRGHYTCRVDLRNDSSVLPDSEFKTLEDRYPKKLTVFMRVQEANRWQLPVYIFAGETALIGLFTLIISQMEKNSEKADGQYEDSDDEDEVQTGKNGNGMHNNNSNGK